MIRAEQVTKRYGRFRAVDDVSFSIARGESVALWGTNGAGKTTLIRCVLGVARFKGLVEVSGIDVSRRGKAARSLIGYVPQELAFHDDARVAPSLAFFGSLRRVDARAPARSLDAVGLTGHEHKRLRDLSGGMKQRLALAIALLSDPPVIVLDEPTSNLDAGGRAEVVAALGAQRQRGKTIVFASHRHEEVRALADRVIVLESGRVAREASPGDLWPTDHGARLLRVVVAGCTDEEAAEALRRAGHAVTLNGRGVCVRVRADHKAEPIESLVRANIRVRDLELLDAPAIEEAAS